MTAEIHEIDIIDLVEAEKESTIDIDIIKATEDAATVDLMIEIGSIEGKTENQGLRIDKDMTKIGNKSHQDQVEAAA